ncbi:hypothetical protein ACSQ67_021867 [Phaseolus vulgaris]
MHHNLNLARLWLALLAVSTTSVHCKTSSEDVAALNVMYSSLNSPSKLSGWKSSGGDPCGESWKGIKCSGSSVTEINLSDMGLSGSTGYQLSSLSSYSDLSNNNLKGDIPYQLPPKARHIDLSNNGFTGSIPFSVSQMDELSQLNLGHNQLQNQLGDMFEKLTKLKLLDVSFNSLSGNLPQSLKSLKNLKKLHLQNNQFTGSINVLANLPLEELHVENNKFTGWVPEELKSINDLQKSSKPSSQFTDEERRSHHRSRTPLASQELSTDPGASVNKEFKGGLNSLDSTSIDVKALQKSPSIGVRSSASDCVQSFNDNEFANRLNSRRSASIRITTFSLADLYSATASFGSGRLLGEGSIGCVYRAKYADGKVLAVKKSTLRFSKVVPLRNSRRLNGSLHGFLHLSDDFSKPLTWNTRIRIALGTARAIEYLHETCSPPLLHKNIKSSNILLDTDLNPRLSDYGLASFHQRTSQNLGAGYNAPECTKPSAFTLKSDVYSFGVVMLELLTGRMAFDSSKPKAEQCLVRWATPLLHDINAVEKMVDPALRGLYPPKSLFRFADVIALSVQSEPEFRPPVSELVQALMRLVQRSSMTLREDFD